MAAMDDLPLPLPQSVEFARACAAMGLPLRRSTCESGGRLRGLWQIQSRSLPVLGRIDLISRGPVWRDPEGARGWLDRWRWRHDGRPLLLNADGLSAADLRSAGFWPLVTPVSVALLDLGPSKAMRGALRAKWRNRLVRAEAAGLTLHKTALTPGHWLLQAEAAQQRTRRYRGPPPAFCAAFAAANPGAATVITAERQGTRLAAGLFLTHGSRATYQIGFSSAEGRAAHAMNLVLWTAMTDLAARGIDQLDLGTLNSDDAPGLAHFKLGTGARAHRLGGTWLHLPALAPIARHLPDRFAA